MQGQKATMRHGARKNKDKTFKAYRNFFWKQPTVKRCLLNLKILKFC